MKKTKSPICDRNCFCCQYDDCILEELTIEDYRAARQMEAEFIFPKSRRELKIAAYQKAYYEANREKVAAANKAYREANREKVAAANKAYYEANREKADERDCKLLMAFRAEHGYTQRDLARMLSVSASLVGFWEQGRTPIRWDLLRAKFPEVWHLRKAKR